MDFEKIGNGWYKVSEIVAVTFSYESEFREVGVSGLMQKTETEKVQEVAIYFSGGSILIAKGEDATEFANYWKIVTEPFGDVA